MLRFGPPVSRRFAAMALLCGTTVTGVGAATLHRFAVSQTTGAGGATAFLQTSASGGALQGQVATTVNTSLPYPFGVFGDYNVSGSTTFGIGVVGASTTGYGVAGESTASQPGVFAYNAGSGNGPGLSAVTASTSSGPAISAQSKGSGDAGDFVGGVSGFGINAYGPDIGVYATGAQQGINASGLVGVVGIDLNYPGDPGIGVEGNSSAGMGTYGTSVNGEGAFGVNTSGANPSASAPPYADSGVVGMSSVAAGVYAASTSGNGLYATSNENAIVADTQNASAVLALSSAGGVASLAEASGTAVSAIGSGSDASDPALTVVAGESTTPDLLRAYAYHGALPAESFAIQGGTENRSGLTGSNSAASDVQVSGDLYVVGQVFQDCQAFPVTRAGSNATPCAPVALSSETTSSLRSSSGTDVAMYGTHDVEPRVETDGGGELVNGRAYVTLDPRFAQTISMRTPYRVFITPDGDSRGVFVSNRTPRGFEVQENGGGRSTMAFDYRILGEPFDERSRSVGARGSKPVIAAIPDPRIANELRQMRVAQKRANAARSSTSRYVTHARAAAAREQRNAAALRTRAANKRLALPPVHPLISAASLSH